MTLDEQLLIAINGNHTPFMDMVMWAYTLPLTWIPFYVACFCALFYKFGWSKALFMLAVIGVAVGLSDYICASIIRPAFQRLRPSNIDNPISQYITVVNNYRGGSYGFPSCHAANCFALAAALGTFTKSVRFRILLASWAIFISYTRIYLGVHYPTDILMGGLIGSTIGVSMAQIARYYGPRIKFYRQSHGYRPVSLNLPIQANGNSYSLSLTPILIPIMVLLLTLSYGALASL